jgi:small subunit ribosomal protein S6
MHARALKRHREYEIVYLLAPTTTPGRAEKVGDSIREVLEGAEGKLLKVTLWGIRSLAYRIKGHKQAIYYYMRFVSTQGAVDEIERRLKLADVVLRYLTVRLSKHEVDPADYTVKDDEAAFKGIDDLHASLQAGDTPEREEGAEAEHAGGDEKPAPEPEKIQEAKAADDAPEVEVAPAPAEAKDGSKDADTEEKS